MTDEHTILPNDIVVVDAILPKVVRSGSSVLLNAKPPGVVPGRELTGTYVQEGVLRWGCAGAEPPRSRLAQRKKMGSIGCLKRFSTED